MNWNRQSKVGSTGRSCSWLAAVDMQNLCRNWWCPYTDVNATTHLACFPPVHRFISLRVVYTSPKAKVQLKVSLLEETTNSLALKVPKKVQGKVCKQYNFWLTQTTWQTKWLETFQNRRWYITSDSTLTYCLSLEVYCCLSCRWF